MIYVSIHIFEDKVYDITKLKILQGDLAWPLKVKVKLLE